MGRMHIGCWEKRREAGVVWMDEPIMRDRVTRRKQKRTHSGTERGLTARNPHVHFAWKEQFLMKFWLCFKASLCRLCRVSKVGSWKLVGGCFNSGSQRWWVSSWDHGGSDGSSVKWPDPASIYPRLTRCLNGLLEAGREMKGTIRTGRVMKALPDKLSISDRFF